MQSAQRLVILCLPLRGPARVRDDRAFEYFKRSASGRHKEYSCLNGDNLLSVTSRKSFAKLLPEGLGLISFRRLFRLGDVFSTQGDGGVNQGQMAVALREIAQQPFGIKVYVFAQQPQVVAVGK